MIASWNIVHAGFESGLIHSATPGYSRPIYVVMALASYVLAASLLFLLYSPPLKRVRVPFVLLAIYFFLQGASFLSTSLNEFLFAKSFLLSQSLKVATLVATAALLLLSFPRILQTRETQLRYLIQRRRKRQICRQHRIRRELEEAKAKYEGIFRNSVEGIFQTGTDGTLRAANPAFARMLGYSDPDDLIRSIQDVDTQLYKHPEDRRQLRCLVERHGIAKMDYEARSKDGSTVILSASGREVRDCAGRVRYFESIVENITEQVHTNAALREQQRQLERSERRHRALVSAASVVVFSADPEGRFLGEQTSWESYTGQRSTEAQGWGWLEQIHPTDRLRFERCYLDGLRREQDFKCEARLWHRASGSYRYFEGYVAPLRQDNGKVDEWAGSISDVDESRRADAETRKFKSLIDNANDAYFLVCSEGNLVYVNRIACEMLGYSQRELLSMQLSQIDRRMHGQEYNALFLRAGYNRVPAFETCLLTKDSHEVAVELGVSHLEYDGRVYLLAVARDITDRKQVDASLRKHADELARSNRELEHFAFASSHDLKEPLRMTALYVELLKRRLDPQLDEKSKSHLEFVIDNSRRIQQMVQDLATYSQVGKALTPFVEFSCNDALEKALEILHREILESGVNIHISPLPRISAHFDQIVQLFQNLLANAIKFRSTRTPEVRIFSEQRNGQTVIAVRDNGIGMNPRYLTRIFVIFQKLHARREFPGTGVGLSICKRIVEHHEGAIWAESQLDHGSTFYISLPSASSPTSSFNSERGRERSVGAVCV